MKVKVVAYKKRLVIIPDEPEKAEVYWVPVGHGHVGSVVLDTSANLGVSEEALELLKQVECSNDDVGDVDWWFCIDGSYAFSWLGPLYGVIDPTKAEGSSQYNAHSKQHITIPNDVPEDAQRAIDDADARSTPIHFWRKPLAINVEKEDPEACGATHEIDHGSHRGGLESIVCLNSKGHKGPHCDGKDHYWDDILEGENEPTTCCAIRPKSTSVVSTGGPSNVCCCLRPQHDGPHEDEDGNEWDDDIKAAPKREHEPPRCNGCAQAPSLSYKCEIYRGFSCNQLIAAYNAGRADMAAEVGGTWPEEEEDELDPEDVVLRVAALLEQEAATNNQKS